MATSIGEAAGFIYLLLGTVLSATAIVVAVRRTMRKIVEDEIDTEVGDVQKDLHEIRQKLAYLEGMIRGMWGDGEGTKK